MTGFCFTGDIFDLFVWFEVMGVAAYALTAYRPEERGSPQGALNFAITNSIGAYLSLSGIGLIYVRTGALNMAQIGAYILGKGYIDESAWAHGLPWITGVFVACAIVTGAAVFRVAGGVFYGLGDPPSEDPQMAEMAAEETSETDSGKQRTPLTMIIPPAVLVACAAAITLIPQFGA